jgi:DNA-binding transcriptional MerR regulator
VSDHTIGQVVSMLQAEFQDLTISKLRYLEDQGLVTPIRTPSGYRKYTQDDLVRLRYVLTSQRDHYLPLKVIREHLEKMTATSEAAQDAEVRAAVLAPTESPSAPTGHAVGDEPERSLAELAEHLGVEISQLRRLREHGILIEDGPYGPAEQRIARWAVVMIRDGLEPRHLRMFVQFVDREVSFIEQLVTPLLRQRNPEASARARLLAGDLGEAAARLHGAILSRALEDLLRG